MDKFYILCIIVLVAFILYRESHWNVVCERASSKMVGELRSLRRYVEFYDHAGRYFYLKGRGADYDSLKERYDKINKEGFDYRVQ